MKGKNSEYRKNRGAIKQWFLNYQWYILFALSIATLVLGIWGFRRYYSEIGQNVHYSILPSTTLTYDKVLFLINN